MAVRNPRHVANFTDFADAHAADPFRTAYLVVGDHELAEEPGAGGAGEDLRRVVAHP